MSMQTNAGNPEQQDASGVDRLLPAAQMYALLELYFEHPDMFHGLGQGHGFDEGHANGLSATMIAKDLQHEGIFTPEQAAHFIEVVVNCMRTAESNSPRQAQYLTHEHAQFCKGVSVYPAPQLQGVVGGAVLEAYLMKKAKKLLDMYLSRLTAQERDEILELIHHHEAEAN